MSAKTTKSTKEEAKTEGPQGCSCMPAGELPTCCGPEMKEMMSRFIGQYQAKQEKEG